MRFLKDGRIELDTNTVERSIRPLTLQRKTALFEGHDLGAENWAVSIRSHIVNDKVKFPTSDKVKFPTFSVAGF